MHASTHKAVLFAAITILLAATGAAASIPFGSIGYNQEFTLTHGQERLVDLAFFNDGEKPLYVHVETRGGEDLEVSVEPRDFVLQNRDQVSPDDQEKYVVLGDRYVRAVPVTLQLKVPENTQLSKNTYTVHVTSTAHTQQQTETGVTQTVSQQREYTYRVYVPGPTTRQEANTVENRDNPFQTTPLNTGEPSNSNTASGEGSTGESGEADITVRETDTSATSNTAPSRSADTPTGYFSLKNTGENSSSLLTSLLIGTALLFYAAYRRYR